jgi:hypothetical protein
LGDYGARFSASGELNTGRTPHSGRDWYLDSRVMA